MPEQESDILSLEMVQASATPTPTQPDLETTEEFADARSGRLEYFQQLTSKPALHRTVLSERESTKLHQANEKLAVDCQELRKSHLDLVTRYARLASHYTRLKQAYEILRVNAGLAASLMGVGGISVSVAGAITHETWKPILLWGGIFTFSVSFIFLIINLIFGKDKHGPDIPDPIN